MIFDIGEYLKARKAKKDPVSQNASGKLSQVQIYSEFKTRPFKFRTGQDDVASRLIITIQFNDSLIKPHHAFEQDFCDAVAAQLIEELDGGDDVAGVD